MSIYLPLADKARREWNQGNYFSVAVLPDLPRGVTYVLKQSRGYCTGGGWGEFLYPQDHPITESPDGITSPVTLQPERLDHFFWTYMGTVGWGGCPPPLTWGNIAPLGIVGVDRGTFGVCIPFTMLNRESNGHDEYQTVWVKHDHLTRQK